MVVAAGEELSGQCGARRRGAMDAAVVRQDRAECLERGVREAMQNRRADDEKRLGSME